MSTGYHRGMLVVAVMLMAGCLFAVPANVQNAATAGMLSGPGLTSQGQSRPGSLSPRLPGIMYNNDVGVSNIISPNGIIAFGDRVFPRGRVQNFGARTQTNIAVICVIYDSAAGARVYGPETMYVANLDSGSICNVDFPFWAPPTEENVYFDTMTTALPGDEDTTNDRQAGRFAVAVWGNGHLSYNDGTFENAISWVFAGSEFTERFVAPERPLTLSKAQLWLTSFSGSDYDAEIRVYGNDGTGGCPGTQLGSWTGQLQTDTWMLFRRNDITFDPPIEVNYDTFFVSWYETSIDPHYPYMALDEVADTIDIGNDWGWCNKDSFRIWGPFPLDADYDFAIDALYDAPLLDGSNKEIAIPQGQIDSSTTFTPQVVVKNAGLCDRDSIAVEFYIVSATELGDTVYSDTANSGPIKAGQTKTVTFGQSITPAPGYYTMTSITLLPYDARRGNDTLVKPLAVGRLGIAAEKNEVGRASFTITPNPMARTATVRYSLPKGGLVTLDVYDATGRGVLSQTITAGRTGTASFDLRELQAGVYVVRVKGDAFSTTQKLVVQR
jgi:hypothetical protein